MSCTVCYGHPGCPVCSPDPEMVECPKCNGGGCYIHYDEGEEVIEECELCNGEGVIEYED